MHPGFSTRLGFLPKSVFFRQPIWIHAVSVGEAMAVKNLVIRLKQLYPDRQCVISTVTSTGNKIVKSFASENDVVLYLPLDISFIVSRVIDTVKPSVFVIAETELWPNMISCLNTRKVPVIVINGRLSDSSFKGYSAVKFLCAPLLNAVTLFCVQTEQDASRFRALGVRKDKIRVTGNMKFDSMIDASAANACRHRKILDLQEEEKLWVAASTHPGEEAAVVDSYLLLKKEFPALRLLIAPRHPERVPDVGRYLMKKHLPYIRVSEIPRAEKMGKDTVFLLDTVGQLTGFYSCASIVFVGGSLVKKGGHNILEPAFLGKPVFFGPYMFNFRDITALFLANGAAVQVKDKENSTRILRRWLLDYKEAEALGEKGRFLIEKNQGATLRNLEYIGDVIKSGQARNHSS